MEQNDSTDCARITAHACRRNLERELKPDKCDATQELFVVILQPNGFALRCQQQILVDMYRDSEWCQQVTRPIAVYRSSD
jgi:hypothetical protein